VAYEIVYEPDALEDMEWLTRRDRVIVTDTVERFLTYQPARPSRRRVQMRRNRYLASWELRIGNLRVYYDVSEDPEPVVLILRVAVKVRERVRLRNELMRLRDDEAEDD
jgi:mRNA-degrading endonuclease RelE of RelBE toxin-antitoxin system